MKRIFIAISLSVVLHLVVFFGILHGFHPKTVKNQINNPILQISLSEKTKTLPMLVYDLSAKQSPLINLMIDKLISHKDAAKLHRRSVNLGNSPQLLNQLDNYYSNLDIERKALPISNIDQSMLGDTFISGLPIKLRIYINAFGNVTKVEKLAVMEQDQELAKKLESLLFNTKFLAAKKNGLDVSSYQDIELSMRSMPLPALPDAEISPQSLPVQNLLPQP